MGVDAAGGAGAGAGDVAGGAGGDAATGAIVGVGVGLKIATCFGMGNIIPQFDQFGPSRTRRDWEAREVE